VGLTAGAEPDALAWAERSGIGRSTIVESLQLALDAEGSSTDR
jgi:hypothetical protein